MGLIQILSGLSLFRSKGSLEKERCGDSGHPKAEVVSYNSLSGFVEMNCPVCGKYTRSMNDDERKCHPGLMEDILYNN